jgi:hypothetical protein
LFIIKPKIGRWYDLGANQTWAKVIGIVLLLVGIWGFFTTSILGMFEVNTLHSVVHLLTGAIFAWAGFAANAPVKKTNQWLGIIYVLLGVVGFFALQDLLALNNADNWLHIVIGAVSAGIAMKAD